MFMDLYHTIKNRETFQIFHYRIHDYFVLPAVDPRADRDRGRGRVYPALGRSIRYVCPRSGTQRTDRVRKAETGPGAPPLEAEPSPLELEAPPFEPGRQPFETGRPCPQAGDVLQLPTLNAYPVLLAGMICELP